MQSLIDVKVHRLPHAHDLPLPTQATPDSCGFDLRAAISGSLIISPWQSAPVPTGVVLEFPDGYSADVRGRSGFALKQIYAHNGLIDSDYRNEIFVLLLNLNPLPFIVNRGDRIAQLVFVSRPRVNLWEVDIQELSTTVRGQGGLGSTGIH